MINLPFWFQMPTADFTLLKSMFVFVPKGFVPYCEEAIKSNQSSTCWSLKSIHVQQLRRGSFHKWFQLSWNQFEQRMTIEHFRID